MAFAVVVDVPPVEAAAAARTLSTCNAALGAGQCVLPGAGSDNESHWYAVVRYGSEGQARLTIELHEGKRDGTRVASSELEFKERDSADERWASVGVVVAALVLAQPANHGPNEQKAAPAPIAPARPEAVNRPSSAVPARPWLRVDLGLTAGSEVRSAPLRIGPLGRFGIAFANVPAFAFASGAYTVRSSGSTDLSWLIGSLGAGVRVDFAHERAALEVRGELVLETLGIQATASERTENARRTRFGPRFGLDLSGYWAKNWALIVGAEVGVMSPRVVIDVLSEGQTVELPPFVWGLLSAVRYDFR